MMNGMEKSDSGIVAVKSANKGTAILAESMERRTRPEGNPGSLGMRRAQDRESVTQAADRIRRFVKRERRERLATLLHHVTVDALRWAFFELKKDASAGTDGVTWRMYEEGLEGRLANLHDRVHSGAYRTTPSRRVNIAKPGGGTRPLGIAALEDKIVQNTVTETILMPIYEADDEHLEANQGGSSRADASRRGGCGAMAREGGQRMAELLRRSEQHPIPAPICHAPQVVMAPRLTPQVAEGSLPMGPTLTTYQDVLAEAGNPTPVAGQPGAFH